MLSMLGTPTASQRFWAKVDKNGPVPQHAPELGPCWVWTASLFRKGYGQFNLDSRGPKRSCYAHRVAYYLVKGPIPENLELDHLCRNHRCVNPEHLEPVTRQTHNSRGQSPSAKNAAKTCCLHGHPYDLINTLFDNRGGRQCRMCARERMRGLAAHR